MQCSQIGSLLQAVGAAIEFYAFIRIIWPWLRPKLNEIGPQVLAGLRRLWPWPRTRPALLDLDPVSASSGASLDLSASGYVHGPDDDPAASPGDRIDRLVRRVGHIEGRVKDTESDTREHRKGLDSITSELAHLRDELWDALAAETESTARIRIADARLFAFGVLVTLVGSAWGVFC